MSTLVCTSNSNCVDLSVTEGSTYQLLADNYGEFFEDDKGNEHYLSDLEWESSFCLIN